MRFVSLIFLLFLESCTVGNLPGNGAELPAVNGGNLKNVAAATVNGVAAADVAMGAVAANAASSDTGASTIVKRDASGNFTAGTITGTLNGGAASADYATGKRITIDSASTLNLNGGDSFYVNGTLDVYRIKAAPNGARATLFIVDSLTLHHNAAPVAGEFAIYSRNFRDFPAASGDTIELFSNGTYWRILRVSNVADSEVEATAPVVTLNAVVWTTIPFPVVSVDPLTEFDGTTFIAHSEGVYAISANLWIQPQGGPPWTTGVPCALAIDVDGPANNSAPNFKTHDQHIPAAGDNSCIMYTTTTLRLHRGSKVRVIAIHALGSPAVVTPTATNALRIVRVR